MKKLIKLFKNHSPYLVFLTLAEICLSVVCTIAFVYSDKLSFAESNVFQAIGVERLLEAMYSSTWWALILLLLAFIAIFSLATMLYRKLDYLFFAICCWIVMLVLAINLNNTLMDNLSVIMMGLPIIIINCIAYSTEKKRLTKKKATKDEYQITTFDRIGYGIMIVLVISIAVFLMYQFGTVKKNKKETKTTTTTTTQVVTTTKKVTKKASKK